MRLFYVAVILAGATGFAQAPPDQTVPHFEVASIKMQKPVAIDPLQPDTLVAGMPIMKGGPGTSSPGRIHYTGVTLMGLITKAYEFGADQVDGPGWLREDRYTVDAIVPSAASQEQFRQMLQNLLVERFKLTIQWEEKEFRVYRLVIAEGGSKLNPSAFSEAGEDDANYAAAVARTMQAKLDSAGCPVLPATRRDVITRNQCMTFVGWSVAEFADMLAMYVANETGAAFGPRGSRAHIIDETGLSGRFNFHLFYDSGYHMMMNVPIMASRRQYVTSKNPISIFKAIEKDLGLKLEPTKSKLKVMVIQHAEKMPSEN